MSSFHETLRKELGEHWNRQFHQEQLVRSILERSGEGLVAFFPAGHFTREILRRIQILEPQWFTSHTLACFDPNPGATTADGVQVLPIGQLASMQDQISLLVVAANTFHAREIQRLKPWGFPDGFPNERSLLASYFDASFPWNWSREDLLDSFDRVWFRLEDEASRVAYGLSWLSRIWNEEGITSLFEQPRSSFVDYSTFNFQDLPQEILNELRNELYLIPESFPGRGEVVLDIGAFRGDTAIQFASLVGEGGRVISFEPVQGNLLSLEANLRRNGLLDRVTVVNAACIGHSGGGSMVSPASGAPWAYLCEEEGGLAVPTLRIDDYVRETGLERVDFIKIDVEGQELSCLEGARETIFRCRPRMVIPLYHKTTDLVQIPEWFSELADYRMYFRCKMSGPFAPNLHCVPRSQMETEVE